MDEAKNITCQVCKREFEAAKNRKGHYSAVCPACRELDRQRDLQVAKAKAEVAPALVIVIDPASKPAPVAAPACEVKIHPQCLGTAHATRPVAVPYSYRGDVGFEAYVGKVVCARCADYLKLGGLVLQYARKCGGCGSWGASGLCDVCRKAHVEQAIAEARATLPTLNGHARLAEEILAKAEKLLKTGELRRAMVITQSVLALRPSVTIADAIAARRTSAQAPTLTAPASAPAGAAVDTSVEHIRAAGNGAGLRETAGFRAEVARLNSWTPSKAHGKKEVRPGKKGQRKGKR